MKKHTLPPEELDLRAAVHEERHRLEAAEVPIVTVSATYRKELADKYRDIVHTPADVVYSRGHFSMAEAVRQQALAMGKKTHMVDPTNFVSKEDWGKIKSTETIGELVARHKLLKLLRDKMDRIIRGKLPIKEAIISPLMYLVADVKKPIISMHYETGNLLAKAGKTIVQAVTDPYVHSQYLDALPYEGIYYAVFDEDTKEMLLTLAHELGKEINKNQVVVTGPFVDPRIIKIGKKQKTVLEDGPVNIAITTGGIGTNFVEIKSVLKQLAPLLVPPERIRLFLFASTHRDFRNLFEDFASENNVRIGNLDDEEARIRVLYEDSIVDANENLIKYVFPWAHGVITKPSGDMAYDAALSGCFLLFLSPWGVWEERVREVFVKEGVGCELNVRDALDHFGKLLSSGRLVRYLKAAYNLPEIFRDGCRNIITLQASLKPD